MSGGYMCSQGFYGCTFGSIIIYGMKPKGDFVNIYKEYLKEVGIPHTFRRDVSKQQGVHLLRIWKS